MSLPLFLPLILSLFVSLPLSLFCKSFYCYSIEINWLIQIIEQLMLSYIYIWHTYYPRPSIPPCWAASDSRTGLPVGCGKVRKKR
jgi:hypothetical protein